VEVLLTTSVRVFEGEWTGSGGREDEFLRMRRQVLEGDS
jgi:hypothetical protein